MMSLWDALRMNMMISYQELVRTFLRASFNKSRLALVDMVNRSPFHKAAMRRIYSDLPEQSIARRVLLDFIG